MTANMKFNTSRFYCNENN